MNLKTLEDLFKDRDDLQITISKGYWSGSPPGGPIEIEVCMMWKEQLNCGCLKDGIMHGYGKTVGQALEDVWEHASILKK